MPGRWSGSGKVAIAYQWYRCDTMGRHCNILGGATRRSRTLGARDVGHTLGLQVRATDANGTTTANASLIGPVSGLPVFLTSTKQPAISGTFAPGSTLSVNAGVWKPAPTSVSYQWVRCSASAWACEPIHGATSNQYALSSKDTGHAVVAIVEAKAGAISRAVFSVASAAALAGGETTPPAKAKTPAPVPTPPAKTTPAPTPPAKTTPAPTPPAKTTPAPTPPAKSPAPAKGKGESLGPANSVPPSIAQLMQVGSQLNGNIGSWSGAKGTKYGYQWYRCDTSGAHCSTIRGAKKITYIAVAKDAGHTLGLRVRATDVSGTTKAYTGLVGPVAAAGAFIVSSGQPTITGTPTQGQTLQVSPGGWSQPPAAVSYQWERCNANGRLCTPIAGATTSNYVATADDGGHALLAVVHAAVAGAMQDAFSSTTRPISVGTGPALTSPPTVGGMAQAGKQLTATTGTWSGSGITYGYDWYRCDASGAHCSSIHGATHATYTEVAKDVGQTLAFAVHAANAAGTTAAFTGIVGPVAAASSGLVATAQPSITGSAAQGQTLQAGNGTWTVTPTGFGYQWLQCNANGRLCTPIPGATAATYAVTAADAGHTVVVLVTASTPGVSQGALSTPTAPVP